MILFQEALNIALSHKKVLEAEQVHFHKCIGRILAQDILSDIEMPPFNKAAMDGFALRETDFDKELTIIETIAAGQTPTKKVNVGETARIMTGAPVPEGADFVVQVELSELINENTVRFTQKPKNSIVPRAEDVRIGDVVLRTGQLIDARHIAVMASVGCTKPLVYKQALIGVISTGDEIVEPQNTPATSQIRNSNGHQLVAQVLGAGAIPHYFGIVEDTYEATAKLIKEGMEKCDILLLTGGVSMGEFDFIPKVMEDLDINIKFDRVAVQPGKPTTFGVKGDKVIIGLPGNPVSSLVQFEILAKPLIYKMMGYDYKCPVVRLTMSADFKRRKSDRRAYIPVQLNDKGEVLMTNYHGSAHIHALPNSKGLAVIEIGQAEIKKGELVDVRLF